MKSLVMTVSFAAAGILTATGAAAATTSSGTGGFQLANQTCLVPAATPAAGTQLQVGSCSSASATGFTLAPSNTGATSPTAQGAIVANGFCLDAASGTPAFNNCNLTASQEWTWLPGTSALKSVSTGHCVNAAGFTTGSSVSLAACQSGPGVESFTPINFNMMFVSGVVSSSTEFGPHAAYLPPELPPSAVSDSTVLLNSTQLLEGAAKAAAGGGTLPFSGNVDDIQCLDTYLDLETVQNEQIDAFQCNATNAQWYHFTPGLQLESESNTCVTATGGSAGAAVNLEACNGSTGQQWIYTGGHLATFLGAGELLANYCLDVQGENGTPLTPVVVNNCGFESWPSGQYWWANLIWPADDILYATQQTGGPNVSANVKLALHKSGQFTMTPTVQNTDQLTGFTYTLSCNIGPFAVGYSGNVDREGYFGIGGPGVDTPGTFGVVDPGITTNWATLSSVWAVGPGNSQFGCQLNETSNLSQTLQSVEQVLASVVLQELMIDPTTGIPDQVNCIASGGDAFVCGQDPRACVASGAPVQGQQPPQPPSTGASFDCEPDSFPLPSN